jgi:hypothetical protein
VAIEFMTDRAEPRAKRGYLPRTDSCRKKMSGPSSVLCSSLTSGNGGPGATTAG